MKLHKELIRKVNFRGESFEVKVTVKYKWDGYQRLEKHFEASPTTIDKMYRKIIDGEAKFLTILVEAESDGIRGSDCLGTVLIDDWYTVDSCVEENKMMNVAIEDLLKQMGYIYTDLEEYLSPVSFIVATETLRAGELM